MPKEEDVSMPINLEQSSRHKVSGVGCGRGMQFHTCATQKSTCLSVAVSLARWLARTLARPLWQRLTSLPDVIPADRSAIQRFIAHVRLVHLQYCKE